ncbi:hypothetical protein RIR_jg12101.t1 [Rhizophagus irregularis DAOM 181602=DAOM 197198]|nr:hypothetical protein RIR_jg12101.t1 [Rhizophagus irregularis DAOM 181602=DAOM 197198]
MFTVMYNKIYEFLTTTEEQQINATSVIYLGEHKVTLNQSVTIKNNSSTIHNMRLVLFYDKHDYLIISFFCLVLARFLDFLVHAGLGTEIFVYAGLLKGRLIFEFLRATILRSP